MPAFQSFFNFFAIILFCPNQPPAEHKGKLKQMTKNIKTVSSLGLASFLYW